MTPEDRALWKALDDWQEKTMIALYGHALLQDIGSSLAMPTNVLNCIVDCACAFKMKTSDDSQKETRWDGADKWGSDVICLVERLQPQRPPALTTNPAPLSTSTTTNITSIRKPCAPTVCGTCGAPGHNGKSLVQHFVDLLLKKSVTARNQKFHPSKTSQLKENAPP
jgi:hypothetical protein